MTHKSLDKSALQTVFAVFVLILMAGSVTFASTKLSSEVPGVFNKCWENSFNTNPAVGPAADASAVYVLDDANKLHAIDLAVGTNIWSSDIGGEVVSNLLVLGDSLFLVTNSHSNSQDSSVKTKVRAISRHTGITAWQAEIPSSSAVWLGAVAGRIVAASAVGSVSAFSPADGGVVWKTDLTSELTAEPYFYDLGIDLGLKNRDVVSVSAAAGRSHVVWKSEYLPTAVLTDSTGRSIVGDERGNLTRLSPEGKRVWRFRNGAQISSVSVHGSEYLAASYDNFIYKLSRAGRVKWKRRLPGRAIDKPFLLGDTAVVSIAAAGDVYALDIKTGKILNRIETGEEISARVTAAPGDRGFVIASSRAVLYFNSKCPGK
ncbi:MAG: PQQ-binding-like beta-propeller repeat protein [Acidobacteriota bacterium]